MAVVLLVEKHVAQATRITLQRGGYYDNARRIVTLAGQNNVLCLPITIDAFTVLSNDKDNEDTKDFVFASLRHQSVNNKQDIVSPRAHLIAELETLVCKKLGEELLKDVPSSWQKVGDAVILPKDSFQNPLWSTLGDELWVAVAKNLNASRIAVGNEILPDPFRTPNLKLVLGESGWVQHRENGIVYCLDITKSMFASGNTTERVRIGNLTCTGETVLDLYSGVGYFVLPYLVHANASTVHACEWNPHAVEGLRRGLQANGRDLSAKCIIHFGDNRKVAPVGIADRVNLGLIPSSEEGWLVACKALKPQSGGWLHVHGCVSAKECSSERRTAWKQWAQKVKLRITELLDSTYKHSSWTVLVSDVVQVKPYAPHIDHLVVDLDCRPFYS